MVANQMPGVPSERPIREGKIQGSAFSFTVQNPQEGDQLFKGILSGDELNDEDGPKR
jgi:hypothetical protein